MAVYRLDNQLWFPAPPEYEDHGIVAVGGDLSIQRLILAYQHGIFPWYNETDPITWWCPIQRMVLRPSEVKVSKSSRNLLNRGKFTVTADTCFTEVIDHCQKVPRPGQQGTWLNEELKEALKELHRQGYAHSIECFEDGELVGGLYGLSMGRMFFGESMFSLVSNASKIAFIRMNQTLEKLNFSLVDCQIYNPHLESLGAYEIPREEFLAMLKSNPFNKTLRGKWTHYFDEQ